MTQLESILTLKDVKTREDIKPLSHAIFPGTHCPLFGVTMIASFIKDLTVVVLGTEECTYYSKDFAYLRQRGKDNFYSLVVSEHDITFGCEDKITEALKHIDRVVKPKAIMLVTTCVLEVIGEDVEGIKMAVEDDLDAKLLVVNTEHFKFSNHISGMEDSLKELLGLMEQQEKEEGTVNILGYRQHDIEKTELYNVLKSEGVKINTILPAESSIESLKTTPKGALNIVTEFIALPLAEQMKEKFDIPFIYFDKYLSVDRISKGYMEMDRILGTNIVLSLNDIEQKLRCVIESAKEQLRGKTFIYGNAPLNAFEVSSFLTSLEMKPLMIQARDLYENDSTYINEILELGHNPLVTKIANIAPLRKVYDEFKPDFYIGHENPMELIKRNITQVTLDDVTKGLGYEVSLLSIDKILLCLEQKSGMGGMIHGAV